MKRPLADSLPRQTIGRYRRRQDMEAVRFDGTEQSAKLIEKWATRSIPGLRIDVYGLGRTSRQVD